MKSPVPRILLVLPLAASSFLTSCITGYDENAYYPPTESGYTTYVALPSDYSGDAYYYNNRYYAGGRYEPGTYTYRGRTYTNRYYHNGQYLYGGDYRAQATAASYRDSAVGSPSSVRYVTYRNLPRDYSGDAYYYNNTYYAGGRYEPGTYTYRGRTYNSRYYHNGRYLYGGDYRQSASTGYPQRTSQRTTTYRTITR